MTLQGTASSRDIVKNTIKTKHPRNVAELVMLLSADGIVNEDNFVMELSALVSEGAIELKEPSYHMKSIADYFFTMTVSAWFWATLILAVASLLSIMIVPDVFPVNTIRWALGSIFVVYLPGHMLLQALFPSKKDLDGVERLVLSVGLSLAVVPLIGLMLNYLPWGIRLAPITASLTVFVVLFALIALGRKYRYLQAKSYRPAT